MRINVITSPFGELPPLAVGAVEKLFHQLAGVWAERGHEVAFVCAGGGDNASIRYVRLGKCKRTGHMLTDLPFDLWYSLKAVLFMPKCDVLVCNTFWSPILAPFVPWKYKKLVYGVHRYPKGQFGLYQFVHSFICVSTAVAEALRKQIGAKRDIVVISNPVDTSVFYAERRKRNSGSCFVVVYAGRIHPEKGLDLLFRAAESLARTNSNRQIVLKLVGPTDVSKGCGGDAYVSQLNALAPHVERVWVGELREANALAQEIRDGDCFVYPSIAENGESFGVAPLEAMALGEPTVVSRLECFSDFVEDGETGYVFDHRAKNPENELQKVLLKIIEDAHGAVVVGAKAAERAERFSVHNVAEEYLSFFSRLFS